MQIIVREFTFEGEIYSDDTRSHLLLAVSALDTDVHEHKVWAIDRLTRALGVSPEHDPYLRCALDFVLKTTQIPVLPVNIESSLTCRSIHPVLVDPFKSLFVQAGIKSGTVASYVNELAALLRAVDSEWILATKSHYLFQAKRLPASVVSLTFKKLVEKNPESGKKCMQDLKFQPACAFLEMTFDVESVSELLCSAEYTNTLNLTKEQMGHSLKQEILLLEEQAVLDFFTRHFPTRDLRDLFLEQAALTVIRKFSNASQLTYQ
ncbi:hypothetical protein BCR33DRAFT_739177 [Rhizoclosmatium globosum]|uniref:Uncharacterized protein n=1 Tax=Rhizoclosmatium globosum TaxID=329046 RepID=A0A1Y2C6I6_9FUNG|nr:hypothetical protein BCR33DRAFT_739177 [Rhizoclosmatium globosum]|eukprot:ORY42651.1 hypothetical protein BCR33DRAFT_739177 [Rhizoclosmatium globosum]